MRNFWRSMTGAALVAALLLSSGAAAQDRRTDKPPRWNGPSRFERKDGKVTGDWWMGGTLGVVYYTGPHAQKMKIFEQVGRHLARKMGLPYREIHAADMRKDGAYPNTIIAYPDGAPRARLFIMPGGHASLTMMDIVGVAKRNQLAKNRHLFEEARQAPQQAFAGGMNYVGVCGGCFVATSGYTVPNSLCLGWALWPGKATNIGPSMRKPFPNVIFDKAQKDHPLYKATNGGVLRGMFFNGGPLTIQSDIPDTEYFGKYHGGAMKEIEGDWFCVAYRPSDNGQSGRLVIATGHPEAYHKRFLAAMAVYALDHDYTVPDRPVEAGAVVEGVCGDGQMQYYTFDVGEGGRKFTVTLTDLSENCDLYVNYDLPPTFRKKIGRSASSKTADESITIPHTREGVYYIGIYGNHGDPAGAKYNLKVEVE
jgi:hypothetical protein